jgi:taurine dioxygenase
MLDAPELQSATFEIRPSETMVGAEVLGLDLSNPLDEAAFEKVSAALDSFSVVCFRNQVLTPEQHIAFSRRFGPLQVNVRSEFNKPCYPEIYIVSNVLIDGKPIGSQERYIPSLIATRENWLRPGLNLFFEWGDG